MDRIAAAAVSVVSVSAAVVVGTATGLVVAAAAETVGIVAAAVETAIGAAVISVCNSSPHSSSHSTRGDTVVRLSLPFHRLSVTRLSGRRGDRGGDAVPSRSRGVFELLPVPVRQLSGRVIRPVSSAILAQWWLASS